MFENQIVVTHQKNTALVLLTTPNHVQLLQLGNTTRNGKKSSHAWLEFDEDCQGAFCKLCKKRGKTLQRTGGAWITKPFTNWKKAVEKMRAHGKSDVHIQSAQAALEAERAEKEGSVVQRLQQIGEQQKKRNRAAIKALVRCTHFLARQHIPHTTNFDKLVDLVVSCGGQNIQAFVECAGKNATYTSKMANWVLELLDDCEDFEKATGIKVTLPDITSFQDRVGKLFINLVKQIQPVCFFKGCCDCIKHL